MAAQKREPAKNFIDLAIDGSEQQHLAEARPESGRPIRESILALLAEMLKPRAEAR
jgi:hypothetical protein